MARTSLTSPEPGSRYLKSTRIPLPDLASDSREREHDALELARVLIGRHERLLHLQLLDFRDERRATVQQFDEHFIGRRRAPRRGSQVGAARPRAAESLRPGLV